MTEPRAWDSRYSARAIRLARAPASLRIAHAQEMVKLVEDTPLWNGKNLNGCDWPTRGKSSMARRMPIVNREELSPEQQAAYDEVAGIRGRPPEVGPSSVMIHNPEMAAQVNRLSAFLMADTELPEKFRRLAAIIAARSIDCRYVWNAHAAAGRRAGLDDALVDAIRDKKPLPVMEPDVAAAVGYGVELTGQNKVSQETFDAAVAALGYQGTTEFTTIMGYFRLVGLNANAGDIDLPADRTETDLPV